MLLCPIRMASRIESEKYSSSWKRVDGIKKFPPIMDLKRIGAREDVPGLYYRTLTTCRLVGRSNSPVLLETRRYLPTSLPSFTAFSVLLMEMINQWILILSRVCILCWPACHIYVERPFFLHALIRNTSITFVLFWWIRERSLLLLSCYLATFRTAYRKIYMRLNRNFRYQTIK